MKGPREKLLYIPCISVNVETHDYLATIDCDPESKDCGKVWGWFGSGGGGGRFLQYDCMMYVFLPNLHQL